MCVVCLADVSREVLGRFSEGTVLDMLTLAELMAFLGVISSCSSSSADHVVERRWKRACFADDRVVVGHHVNVARDNTN